MAGRKIREALRQEIRKHVEIDPFIVIAGLSNIYTHYITTVEEYNAQRYEAASVIYGENTLQGNEITVELLFSLFFSVHGGDNLHGARNAFW